MGATERLRAFDRMQLEAAEGWPGLRWDTEQPDGARVIARVHYVDERDELMVAWGAPEQCAIIDPRTLVSMVQMRSGPGVVWERTRVPTP